MQSLEQLEAALQADWDLDTLVVYADLLEARGDPRGELIALDLHIAQHGTTPALEAQRRERLVAWLGSDSLLDRPWYPPSLQFGLVHDHVFSDDHAAHGLAAHVDAFLDSPAGPYLRGAQLFTDADGMAEALDLLAARPHPWLRTLALRQTGPGPVPAAIMEAFIAATPHLEELVLHGERVLASPLHPQVRVLRLTGGSSIVVGAAAMPQITELDLTFDVAGAGELPALAALVNPRAFPGLRRLDLSRNEYSYPTTHPSNVDVFAFLRAVERLDRLTHLRLPAVRTDAHVEGVQRLLATNPQLRIEVARAYAGGAGLVEELAHPQLRLPAPRPWPPRDEMSSREALTITVPGVTYGEDLALTSCAEELELRFDTMSPEARDAWNELWRFLDGLHWDDADGEPIVLPFPAATLATALEPMADRRCQLVMTALRDAELAPDAVVEIKRFWGW